MQGVQLKGYGERRQCKTTEARTESWEGRTEEGMTSLRSSPTFMPFTPRSQPNATQESMW